MSELGCGREPPFEVDPDYQVLKIGLSVRAGEKDAKIRVLGAAVPDLLAVDDVLIAIADGTRL